MAQKIKPKSDFGTFAPKLAPKLNKFLTKQWKTLLILLLVISNLAVYFHFKPVTVEDPGVTWRTKYSLLDGSRRWLQQEDLVTNLQPLREYMSSLPIKNKDWADISIYFESLNTGSNISVNQNLQLFPASLAKLPVAMVTMSKVEKGDWSFDTKITMLKDDADLITTPDVESLIGQSFDIKFLLERLILESDNTAYRMLKRSIAPEELSSIGEAVGLDELFSDSGKISAKDYTRLLRALYSAAYLNEDNSQFLLELMQKSEFRDFLKSGLPADVPFAHKWGTNLVLDIYADAGIVYIGNKPYMISVMIQAKQPSSSNRDKANQLMKEISEKAYQYVADYH